MRVTVAKTMACLDHCGHARKALLRQQFPDLRPWREYPEKDLATVNRLFKRLFWDEADLVSSRIL